MNTSTTESTAESQLIEALEWRYATKKFDPSKKIPQETLSALLGSLRLAPSSMGLQPYRILHVKDDAIRAQLQNASMNQPQLTEASEVLVLAAKSSFDETDIDHFMDLSRKARGYDDEAISKRTVSIKRFVSGFDPREFTEWSARQLYIAMGQLLAAAALLGVDACPMEGIKKGEYSRILNLSAKGLEPFAVVTLGYRHEKDALASQAKIRLEMHTLVEEV